MSKNNIPQKALLVDEDDDIEEPNWKVIVPVLVFIVGSLVFAYLWMV